MADILGVIGGSGLYDMEGMKRVRHRNVRTPFGAPSDTLTVGELEGRTVAFLPRHGRGHRIPPSQINFRANVYALKKIGVRWILSLSAVGSMKEEIRPGDLVVVDQFVDQTRLRPNTFFSEGIVAHIPFADPVCPSFAGVVGDAARGVVGRARQGGTYLCMEGPAFSTRAESRIHRIWGVDVIGMTNMPEAKLAREAEMCYASVALATDYDCWHETEADVSIGAVLEIIRNHAENAKRIIRETVRRLPPGGECGCGRALEHALITDRRRIPAATKRRLSLLIGKYL